MIRLMQVSFVVIIVFVLAFGVFQLAMGAMAFDVAGYQPNVGWNSKPTGFMLGGDEPNVGWNSKPTAFVLPNLCVNCPIMQPNVGWNS